MKELFVIQVESQANTVVDNRDESKVPSRSTETIWPIEQREVQHCVANWKHEVVNAAVTADRCVNTGGVRKLKPSLCREKLQDYLETRSSNGFGRIETERSIWSLAEGAALVCATLCYLSHCGTSYFF